jgi:hypothetical protein
MYELKQTFGRIWIYLKHIIMQPRTKLSTRSPYLDQISQGKIGSFHALKEHQKFLVQPVLIPDISHCRVSSDFISSGKPLIDPFVAPDGKITESLRATVQGSLPAIRKAYITRLNNDTIKRNEEVLEQTSSSSLKGGSDQFSSYTDGVVTDREESEVSVFSNSSVRSENGYVPENDETKGWYDNHNDKKIRKKPKKKKPVKVKIGGGSISGGRKKSKMNPKGYVL